jgi:hypothetical protein
MWEEYVKHHAVLPPIPCPGCGREFTPLNKRQKACSGKCSGHARADARYFGGKRRQAIGLVEGICQLCEEKKSPLAAHHIFGKKNDPDNEVLIALCMGCHQLVGILGRRKDVKTREFWENLISLAVVRSWADSGHKAMGTHVTVEIDELDGAEIGIEEVGGLPPGRLLKPEWLEIPF